jgi:hypothetical protein
MTNEEGVVAQYAGVMMRLEYLIRLRRSRFENVQPEPMKPRRSWTPGFHFGARTRDLVALEAGVMRKGCWPRQVRRTNVRAAASR